MAETSPSTTVGNAAPTVPVPDPMTSSMQSGNIFEWLGSALGAVIRGIVHALDYIFSGLGHALGDFTDGFAGALGIHASAFNLILVVVGLMLLAAGVRAIVRRSIVAGIIWLVLAVLILGRLIAR